MQELITLAEQLELLNKKFDPHPGQVVVGRAMLYLGFLKAFVAAGRNWGKSKVAAYLLTRRAIEYPNTAQYYFAPFQKQAREIMWQSRVLIDMIPEELIESVNNTESRVTLTNGSSIKIDGSDNYEAYRGVKTAGLTVCDEIKDFRPEFLEAYMPNTAAFNSPILLIGTPDSKDGVFSEYEDLAKASDSWFYYQAPTSDNPYISKEWLAEKEKELTLMGDYEQWMREFMAVYVRGGKRSIYPMFLKQSFEPFQEPIDINKWILIVAYDPAATSVFGVLFSLHNPYTKKMIVFDEIYEKDANEMTARKIQQKVIPIVAKFKGRVKDIRYVYDEAAAFFRNESHQEFDDIWLEPTRKKELGIDGFISLTRTLFLRDLVTTSVECKEFIQEMRSYEKDEKGRIPDKDDHLINCFWYLTQSAGYNLEELNEPKQKDVDDMRRGYSLDSEMDTGYRELL